MPPSVPLTPPSPSHPADALAPPLAVSRYLADYNVDERVSGFVDAALSQGAQTKGNHVMFTMGSDFNYEAAAEWFGNMDKLIHYSK